MKRLSKAAQARIDAEREARLGAYEKFRDFYTGRIIKARVTWFDRNAGEGYVRLAEGEKPWPLYACNIPGAKTWFPGTACVYFTEGDLIDVEVKPSYGGSLLVCHTPGTFDTVKWNGLDHSKLAFKCNDDGTTTGLFAEGASL